MRNAVIGWVVGMVLGIVVGTTLIAPRLIPESPATPTAEDEAPAQLTPAVAAEKAAKALSSLAKTAEKQSGEAQALPAEPAVSWRMGSDFAADLPQLGTQAKRLETEIWRVSGGEMRIEFNEPGALAPRAETFAAVRSGAIDAAFIAPGAWPEDTPALQLFGSIPFGPDANEYLAWLYFGGGQEMLAEIARPMGIQPVVCGIIAPEGAGWFRKPIRTLGDFQGLKVGMTGLGAEVLRKVGAEPVRLTAAEIFTAFEENTIDGAEFSMPAIDFKLGLHEMARHYYFPGWHQPSTLLALVINNEQWDKLDDIQQSRIRSVCGDNVRAGLAEGEALQFPALMAMAQDGVEVTRWPREVLDGLETAWKGVADELASSDRAFRAVWESLKDFRRDYSIWRDLGEL